ncbi:hypothetical protein AMTRI_Chr04g183990 [Amborella trichopoda]
MYILSWKIHGLGLTYKKQVVRDFCFKYRPTILALTETKLPEPSLSVVCQVWG